MTRPRTWFDRKDYRDAKRFAKDKGLPLWLYKKPTKGGGKVSGYFVGKAIPVRLQNADLEERAVK